MTVYNNKKPIILFGGYGEELAKKTHGYLTKSINGNKPINESFILGNEVSWSHSDGEHKIDIGYSLNGRDVYIFQNPRPEELGEYDFKEMILLNDAAKGSMANKIINLTGHYRGARQDRRGNKRSSLTAKVNADQIESSGANGLVTIDLHSEQIEGFFNDIQCSNLRAMPFYLMDIKERFGGFENVVLTGLDTGGMKSLVDYFKNYAPKEFFKGLKFASAFKLRYDDENVAITHFMGDIDGLHVCPIDDEINTAGTMHATANYIYQNKDSLGVPASITAYATRPKFRGSAIDRMRECYEKYGMETISTNAMQLDQETADATKDYLKLIDVSPSFGQAINRIETAQSVKDFHKLETFNKVFSQDII